MDKTTGQRIEELAAAKGLPQNKELAILFGVTYETLRKWRSGESAPNRARQLKIAKVLEVPPEAFMHGVQSGPAAADLRLARLVENYRAASLPRQQIIYAIAETLNGPHADALQDLFAQMSQAPTPLPQPGQRTPAE